ncbi:MAG: DNA-deoxyinosine glycosylase [Burkholderiales bacterium]|nr:MAG: DNA-deoxyinosine glycosylase [Burkholderiales bacterium]
MTAGPGRAHGFAPVVRRDARLLILGSFPSAASLAAGQYYAHPRNAFWPVLGRLLGEPLAELPYRRRLARVRAHRVAIWDVIGSCARPGSLDSDIREAEHNDLDALLRRAPRLGAVAFNGGAAARLEGYCRGRGLRTYRMPSTSPAHASRSFEQKLEAWWQLVTDGWIQHLAL